MEPPPVPALQLLFPCARLSYGVQSTDPLRHAFDWGDGTLATLKRSRAFVDRLRAHNPNINIQKRGHALIEGATELSQKARRGCVHR
ncbi:hypothetical protein GCM10010844_32510 [Deinococcus radiotolerans]|uniref:Uncharacterized protein n=1 Tax=Deinococcus radiotolerans TaxID=1309407 RepID=A0ABQ2FNG7_9DEIO|nr:hypothetical protein GCM10010844_32510 [Deinococcus radiotolerans]